MKLYLFGLIDILFVFRLRKTKFTSVNNEYLSHIHFRRSHSQHMRSTVHANVSGCRIIINAPERRMLIHM
jgi:hypothetical protein